MISGESEGSDERRATRRNRRAHAHAIQGLRPVTSAHDAALAMQAPGARRFKAEHRGAVTA